MRALAISAVVGAMVLTGCQSTGNNIGGVEYDKAALGTLIGAAAGYGISKGNANTSRQNNRAAAIGAVLVVQLVFTLTTKKRNFVNKWRVLV